MSKPKLKPLQLVLWISLSTGAVFTGITLAAEIDTDNPALSARWDNTVRYNLGLRAEARDSALARNASYDESDAKFDRGDVVTNRVDLMSELEVAYKQYHGVRISGSAGTTRLMTILTLTSPTAMSITPAPFPVRARLAIAVVTIPALPSAITVVPVANCWTLSRSPGLTWVKFRSVCAPGAIPCIGETAC